jgi:hypothetical protein
MSYFYLVGNSVNLPVVCKVDFVVFVESKTEISLILIYGIRKSEVVAVPPPWSQTAAEMAPCRAKAFLQLMKSRCRTFQLALQIGDQKATACQMNSKHKKIIISQVPNVGPFPSKYLLHL